MFLQQQYCCWVPQPETPRPSPCIRRNKCFSTVHGAHKYIHEIYRTKRRTVVLGRSTLRYGCVVANLRKSAAVRVENITARNIIDGPFRNDLWKRFSRHHDVPPRIGVGFHYWLCLVACRVSSFFRFSKCFLGRPSVSAIANSWHVHAHLLIICSSCDACEISKK